MPVRITVYAGFDSASRMAVRVVREASVILAVEYSLPVEVEVVELPFTDEDAVAAGLPEVWVNGRMVSSGSVPSMSSIIDEAFRSIQESLGVPGGLGFPLAYEEGEKGLLGV